MNPGLRLGVCAMGPVGDGDKVHAMRVWVSQQVGDRVVAASGEGGEHLGSHPPSPKEKLISRGLMSPMPTLKGSG
jgi:hypothetical protein